MPQANVLRALLPLLIMLCSVSASGMPVYADGDLAPHGAPDGQLTLGDYLVAERIVLGDLEATELDIAHGDVFPAGAPDGLLNIQDLLLLQTRTLGATSTRYVNRLALFGDGPALLSAGEVSTPVVVDGYTGPGAVVINNPQASDPEDSSNTVWHLSISGGLANGFLGTADHTTHPVLNTGYDLSGQGGGQLVFDLKVVSLNGPNPTLVVKIDSGYPALGQVYLTDTQTQPGGWRRISIDFAELLADPGPGPGLDLAAVVNAFVIEVSGGNAEFYLDNIFISRQCEATNTCRARVATKPGALDADNDGVLNEADQCPGTPAGRPVDAQGCPLPIADADGDGVADADDLCPSTPAGQLVDADGCPFAGRAIEVTRANQRLVGGSGSPLPGFSLYVFDNDLAAPGTSACYGGCAGNWPPLVVTDGFANGVAQLGTITRNDGSLQATYAGRPLYFFAGDGAPGDANGEGLGGVWWSVSYPYSYDELYTPETELEPPVQVVTANALITRFADRARDRHAREDQFQIYDHYLSHYWEHRTAAVEIVDTVGKGGNSITFNVVTEWRLHPLQGELRFFYRGIGTVAEYFNNGVMSAVPALDVPGEDKRHYTRSVNYNQKFNRPLQVGDRLEFELSQFLDGVPRGRNNYYGTTILYIVGQGIVPWEARGEFGNYATEREDSYPIPIEGWLGGNTTLPYQYSDEPDNHFMQMAGNLSNINGQVFVQGRRVHHTDFGDGSHNETVDNPTFPELAGKLGPNYSNRSCVACHARNGRALPPNAGEPLRKHLVLIGNSEGEPLPTAGHALQPVSTTATTEGGIALASWAEANGLRTPSYAFSGINPAKYSVRLAPQLVGMGLLEAIPEATLAALADPDDSNGDGISGRLNLVTDPATGQYRVGRFGWKAGQPSVLNQVAAALHTDMGVTTSVLPVPDCGTAQSGCGSASVELEDSYLDQLTAYVSLLGVSARRDLADPVALAGEQLFSDAGCAACHTPTLQTSPWHPHAELRDQTIHPYTDLLLHDMGPGLADSLGEASASGSEWRTPPLWNIGLGVGVTMGESYLHDGRARTLHEAIMWHGGEGDAARQNYSGMSQSDKDALLAFLKSL